MSKKKASKKFLLDTILSRLSLGISLQNIKKELNIPKQNLHYYLTKLQELGHLKKLDKGQYEVVKIFEHPSISSKKIRGHAFIWTIKLPRKYDWRKRLNNRNIKYKLIRGCIPRIILRNRKIWLGKESITIYEINSFYGENAIQSRKYAVIGLKELVDKLQFKLGINLGRFLFKPSREHFGMIKNDLAIQCNRKGEKIYVRDDVEGEWLWIDDSYAMGELETGGKKALTRSLQVQNWWNDNKKHNFEITSTYILKSLSSLIEDRRYWARHQKSHVKAIQTLAESVKELTEQTKKLKNG